MRDLATKRPPKTEEVCQNERGSWCGSFVFGTGSLGEVSSKLPLFRFDFVVNFCPRSQVVFAHEVKMKQINFAYEVKLQSQKAKCKTKTKSRCIVKICRCGLILPTKPKLTFLASLVCWATFEVSLSTSLASASSTTCLEIVMSCTTLTEIARLFDINDISSDLIGHSLCCDQYAVRLLHSGLTFDLLIPETRVTLSEMHIDDNISFVFASCILGDLGKELRVEPRLGTVAMKAHAKWVRPSRPVPEIWVHDESPEMVTEDSAMAKAPAGTTEDPAMVEEVGSEDELEDITPVMEEIWTPPYHVPESTWSVPGPLDHAQTPHYTFCLLCEKWCSAGHLMSAGHSTAIQKWMQSGKPVLKIPPRFAEDSIFPSWLGRSLWFRVSHTKEASAGEAVCRQHEEGHPMVRSFTL